MEKNFFEAFPNLKLTGARKDLFEQVVVERITATRRKDILRIYIRSERLIEKEDVYGVEQEIKKQFFPKDNIIIKIYEKFILSGQYNPEKLMDTYKDSVLMELKDTEHMLYTMFRQADMEYPDEQTVKLILEDSVIAKSKEDEMIRILDKVLNERCGFSVKFHVDYREAAESKYREEDELKIQQIVANIADRVSVASNDSNQGEVQPVQKTTAAEKKPAPAENTKASEKPASFNKPEKRFEKGGFQRRFQKKSDNPDVIYGRDFDEETMNIDEIWGEMGEVVIRGKVRTLEQREIRNEKTIVSFEITDFTDTIKVKMFVHNEQLPELLGELKAGAFVKVKGVTVNDTFDRELTIATVIGLKKIPDFTTIRMDNSVKKRVELHCHTKMSDMDGVTDVKDIIKRAKKWGHKAIAITDHGCVQSFPDANHALDKDDTFKVIYGVEGYLVDDLKEIVTEGKGQSLDEKYVVFDIETTGFSPVTNRIIEIGAVKVENGEITERFSTFVNPQVPIPFHIEKLTSINDSMVMDADPIEVVLPQFLEFVGDAILVAHNANFDVSFIKENAKRQGIPVDFTYVDTVGIARALLTGQSKYTLDAVAKTLGISLENHHRAVDDAECTAEIFVKFIEMLKKDNILDLASLNELGKSSVEAIRKLHSYHIIILAKNQTGRINLYRLVSESHLTYFHKRPLIPKSLIQKYREGLIIGSACEAGELFRALLDGQSEEQIARIVRFYDYLEIQPLGNNRFMIESEKLPDIKSDEDLIELNKRIVKLGEEFHKPVVATCDVHFIDPQDAAFRKIIMAAEGFADADKQAPLYFRTTKEMLKEFTYLGEEKAREIVITNTNKIADMIEKIKPIPDDTFPPKIEGADEELRQICMDKAISIYGDPLPPIVQDRLETELNSIISNGYAVLYIIAQKLVWKSVADGYLVGSRGSVGSSFAANMAGITEVNSLPPHYICDHCKYSDFESETVKAFAMEEASGCDMPDKDCPVCGHKLRKDGHDIPFQTFLGFEGDKEPDIDLNFSGDYQQQAHAYTEVLFGKGKVFKAGTIGTLADKTAYGFVKKYFDAREITPHNAEIQRLTEGCTGVKRTTGQHPGGLMVVPSDHDIHEFCPIQRPANDVNSTVTTTHFDYHSISGRLLKLDLLGHDDPTVIRMLYDLTGVNPQDVPLGDPETMSLFESPKALGVTEEEINCKTGTLGIPEFGTKFVRGMLIDTKPKTFADLLRISGLSHGTDVWLGNAQTLIENGTITLKETISTRDSIMIYLINKGVEKKKSFKIMEKVRKGKGLTEEDIADMKASDVPDWYIESCQKIKYMFPKAHAAAYVMMAFRIAYFKINYPEAYYASYFSVRACDDFDYSCMCQGIDVARDAIREIQAKGQEATAKDKNKQTVLEIVVEFYARGFKFCPIDLYRSDAKNFLPTEEGLLPPFSSLQGLGVNAAQSIVEGRKDGEFNTLEELKERTSLGRSLIDLLKENGVLDGIPETNQLCLF